MPSAALASPRPYGVDGRRAELSWDFSDPQNLIYGFQVSKYWQRPGSNCPDGSDAPVGGGTPVNGACPLLRRYHGYGSRLTGYEETQLMGGESGNTYVFRVTSLGEAETDFPYGVPGGTVEITVKVAADPFDPTAPAGFTLEADRDRTPAMIRAKWNQVVVYSGVPAYLVQWRKSGESYDPSASGSRSQINAWTNGPFMAGANGFNYAPAPTSYRIDQGLEYSTTYYVKVGTCKTAQCLIADVEFASERSVRTRAQP